MATQPQIPLQPFTRVHLVPGVNGTVAAALVFERQTQEPLAVSLPLEVMGQVFRVLPKVMAQSAAKADSSAPVAMPSVQWTLESFDLQGQGADTRLVLSVDGVQLQLQMDAALMTQLSEQLGQASQPQAQPKVEAKPRAAVNKSKVAKAYTAGSAATSAKVDKPAAVKKKKAGKT